MHSKLFERFQKPLDVGRDINWTECSMDWNQATGGHSVKLERVHGRFEFETIKRLFGFFVSQDLRRQSMFPAVLGRKRNGLQLILRWPLAEAVKLKRSLIDE